MVWCEGYGELLSSRRGYAIVRPDSLPNDYNKRYKNVAFTESFAEAEEIQREMQKDSKWPHCVIILSCWLKEYEGMKCWDINSEK